MRVCKPAIKIRHQSYIKQYIKKENLDGPHLTKLTEDREITRSKVVWFGKRGKSFFFAFILCVLGMPLPSCKIRVLVYLRYAVFMDYVCTCSLLQALLPVHMCEL